MRAISFSRSPPSSRLTDVDVRRLMDSGVEKIYVKTVLTCELAHTMAERYLDARGWQIVPAASAAMPCVARRRST